MKNNKAASGTFTLNKKEPIHRWYSYIEGYSSCLIEDIFDELKNENIKTVYDPFAGTGTTLLVASSRNIDSYYSETNPFMRDVIEYKINITKKLRESSIKSTELRAFYAALKSSSIQQSICLEWNGFEKYFEAEQLSQILFIKEKIISIQDSNSKKIAMLALASIIVRSSKMIRQGDLRFRTKNEIKEEDRDVLKNYLNKLNEIIEDIENENYLLLKPTTCAANDSRDITLQNEIDCVITSPPYLNGTNYIRNTKLELKLFDYIKSELDLPVYHSKGIIAGINNVSKKKPVGEYIPDYVKPYIDELEPVSYDKRISKMIIGYFIDMENVIKKLAEALKNGGWFYMDIGDSQFANIHIPTHEILTRICSKYGFELKGEDILRQRRSKNGMILSQRMLKFKLSKQEQSFREKAQNFIEKMPYKEEPYSGRNWGHKWHSLCSYHGKLKPAIAHMLVKYFTKENDIVLDPLSGVGTIPFEACLQGRIGIGNDLSEMAYIITKAKLEKVSKKDALDVVFKLEEIIQNNKNTPYVEELIEKNAAFGFNGKLIDYYHRETFGEILLAREYLIDRIRNDLTPSETMVFSCLLHILHGNRPYALSRNSHPLTPYAPTGEFVYKNLIEHLKDKIELSYKNTDFNNYKSGLALYGDYNGIRDLDNKVDVIICSPPFVDSIRFYMQNWLRLWFCGWEKDDFKKAEDIFLDNKQKKDFDIYYSFFEMCNKVLKPEGRIILHLGKTAKIDMAEELSKRANVYFEEIYRGTENVSQIEKHGIKDKGATIEHQYLFLQKK